MKTFHRVGCGLLLCLAFLSVPAVWAAQSFPTFSFRHYTVENGLSSNIVRALLQDSRGLVWIGTEDGLNCFDGQHFRQYRVNEGREKSIGSNYACVLFEDARGNIWVGTDEGIYIYDYHLDAFHFFEVETDARECITSVINEILADSSGNIWVATYGQGVFRYQPESGRLKQYVFFQQASTDVNDIFIDSDNRIWAAPRNTDSPLSCYNAKDDVFEAVYLKRRDKLSSIMCFYEDADCSLWLGTWQDGICRFDRESRTLTAYMRPDGDSGLLFIHSMASYSPDEMLIGSDNGLTLFNIHTGASYSYLPEEFDAASLSNKFVYPIMKDHEDGLWIGTYYGGVNYLSPNNGLFESFTHSGYVNSVNGNIISRFCEDEKGNIWIATDDGGLNYYHPQSGRFDHYMPQAGKNSLSFHNVHALCLDGDKLWIGTYTGDLNVLDTRTGRFRLYPSSSVDYRTLDGSSSYAIFKDNLQNIWVATMTGVNIYNPVSDNFTRIRQLNSITIDICQDTCGHIWFATMGKGLYVYSPKGNIWKQYLYDERDVHSLPGNQVNSLCVDARKQLWVATGNGLCRYDAAKDRFERVNDPELAGVNVFCIIDDAPSFWLTTSIGLIQYFPEREKNESALRIFSYNDGLLSHQFIPNAGLKSSTGTIYLGTVNGFNTFVPGQIKQNDHEPPVIITGLTVMNKDVPVDPDGMLTCALNDMKQLNLTYKERMLTLHYAALSYRMPGKNRYAYRLDGFDKEWNEVGTQTTATYTNLKAGTYTFRVKACNDAGWWNEQGASLRIVVHPPFYLSRPAKLLYFLLLLLIVALIIRAAVARTEAKHRQHISEIRRKQENEIYQAKISFFTSIAHEIRTPVSLIIGPLKKFMDSHPDLSQASQDDLNMIDRNSQRLLLLVNQLLDFRKVEDGSFGIHYGRYVIYEVLYAVYERFKPLAEQRHIAFTLKADDQSARADFDKEALTKIVSNLLTNAGKYTRDKIEIALAVRDDCFKITVSDNGSGISEADQKKIFQAFYQGSGHHQKPGTGIGLNLVKRLAEAQGGRVEVISAPEQGSTFVLYLPLRQAAGAVDTFEAAEAPDAAGMADTLEAPAEVSSGTFSEMLKPATTTDRPTLMLVEDNDDMCLFLQTSLEDQYHLVIARNGQDALDKMAGQLPQLIVCDWMMPVMDGLELCKKVHANKAYSHIPFVLLTAKNDTHSKIEGTMSGADDYIEKPFSIDFLKAKIDNLLQTRAMLMEKFKNTPMVPLTSMAANNKDEQWLIQLNEIIEKHIPDSHFTVDLLANEMYISRSGLFAKIKSIADITPNELIQLMRLKKAAELLQQGNYRIGEVAYMVGFNNPSYFAKCFYRQFNIKPNEYRKA